MMLNRLHSLDTAQLQQLHNACMEVLDKTGVIFLDSEAKEIFRANGFRMDGSKVYFTEKQVMAAVKTAPSKFTIHARNPEKSVRIGGDHFVLSPGWGAPFIIDAKGNSRSATMEDSDNLCKLVQTSPYLDMIASSMVPPVDLDPEIATAQLLTSCFIMSDMPVTTNPCSRENAIETLEIASIVWGSREAVVKQPVSIISVNPTSPLTYSPEAAGGLIETAKGGQALLISSMVMAGLSGPITIAGTAVLEMAESLAGIVLAQLVNPGVPCVCGGTSCSTDLRTCRASLGSPEFLKLMSISTQMADFYDIPCRYGGGLTDAHYPDIQAGIESTLNIAMSLASGAHYMHQACGILGSYTEMSFEKFVIDEEVGGMMKRALSPVEISDETLCLESISKTGCGGSFLMDPMTAKRCRSEFFVPKIASKTTYEKWEEDGKKGMIENASAYVEERLAAYEKPDIDPGIEKDLMAYVKAIK